MWFLPRTSVPGVLSWRDELEIVDNKALLLSLRDPKRVTEVIPKSREVGDGKVLVSWGLEEAQVLKNLKIRNVPSPILAHYDWAGQHKPFDHQKTTAAFLTLHRKAFCFNERALARPEVLYGLRTI